MANGVHVVLKLALSLDGRIAARSGVSRWITGPSARARVHALRARYAAVGVGIGTVLADDPELTVRDAPGNDPIRVVFDSQLRLPVASKLAHSARTTRTLVICVDGAPRERAAALESCGVEVLRVARGAGSQTSLDMGLALSALARASVASILVEGGAAVAGALLAGRYVDELHAFIAPLLLGPDGRACAVGWAGPDAPAHAPRIAEPVIERCDADVYVSGRLEYPVTNP
jgi:diaminohydroxyphosphoribosylaminopyrimidine deaminase / 5-amino-6-(5-phosphoribosylamino)uracil reductase